MCGLPDSGKSTYIAALWHCISSKEINTSLEYDGLPDDRKHLNMLSAKWLRREQIEHTKIDDNEQPEMKFRIEDDRVTITFPDHSGEIWSHLWESRHCPQHLATLSSDTIGILLFVHADTIKHPISVVEMVEHAEALGERLDARQEVPYSPELSPTQVQLVDILQLLAEEPFNLRNKRLSIILSAWDLVEAENMTPIEFMQNNLPLLTQYLKNNSDFEEFNIYGVSAQGGDLKKDIDKLRSYPKQSERIRVIDGENQSHDLTLPVLWLMGK